ncbi:MarR family winged helix-turn-helix transcriptional regulator [Hydrogenophaga laconesensis]|uniref:DNA-binding MarR family transcriptional regulator n=1 Tax=Hydrogenophaga laconesensis TaxID=1805971 RepID=A0ABU1VEX1_9BURK|nr:MarR family transcriptional regulator [Hydrogenophaga laconesensis]MDR7096024.1 DNA-binding MarR family transcriptional regulator [Hydrogenophaga laconesensis]
MSNSPQNSLQQIPGHLFRRLHQIAVAKFSLESEPFGLTPLQWAALDAIERKPGVDQSALSRDIALDTSTVAGVIYRLEARGLIKREASATDRRLRVLFLTDEGRDLLVRATPVVMEMQHWLLDPLNAQEQSQFMELMLRLVNRTDVD